MKNQYLKLFLTQTFQFAILYIIFHSTTNEPWFQNKVRDTIVLLISYTVFMIIPFFQWLLNPVTIKVKQENKLGKAAGNTQILLENNAMKTPESQRTINLSIEITRRRSIWWHILMRNLKKKEVKILIEPVPSDVYLQAKDILTVREIEASTHGFFIEVNQVLEDLNLRTGSLTLSKSFPYFVVDHPDNSFPHNVSTSIQPLIIVNGKKNYLLSFLIKFISEEHQVVLFKR